MWNRMHDDETADHAASHRSDDESETRPPTTRRQHPIQARRRISAFVFAKHVTSFSWGFVCSMLIFMIQAIVLDFLSLYDLVRYGAHPNLYIYPHLSALCTTFVVAHIWHHLYWVL